MAKMSPITFPVCAISFYSYVDFCSGYTCHIKIYSVYLKTLHLNSFHLQYCCLCRIAEKQSNMEGGTYTHHQMYIYFAWFYGIWRKVLRSIFKQDACNTLPPSKEYSVSIHLYRLESFLTAARGFATYSCLFFLHFFVFLIFFYV